MRAFTGLIVLTLLAGCSVPPTVRTAGSTGSLSSMESRVKAHGAAPNTRQDTGTPGALVTTGTPTSATTGRPETFGRVTMTLRLDNGAVDVDARMINPTAIRGIPQIYNNDCAQAAIATTLDFLGVNMQDMDPYAAVSQGMPPAAWGTRMEDVSAFINSLKVVGATPVRQASLSYIERLLAQGKPVPVVLSLSDTTMHYLVVIGTGVSQMGQTIILYKDPSNPDPSAVGALDDETFEATWENKPVRGAWWSFLAPVVSHTNPDNYQRLAFDVGIKGR